MTDSIEVQAAGGVVVREADGEVQLLLVHRPRYDDWSFPKGKLDAGESFEQAALREVLEETALSCRRADELPASIYRDAGGRLKIVRYWLMEALAGDVESRAADEEVDTARWISLEDAHKLLTYPPDRELAGTAVEIFVAGGS